MRGGPERAAWDEPRAPSPERAAWDEGDGNRSFAFAPTRSRREQVPPADGLLQERTLWRREDHAAGRGGPSGV